MIEAREALLQKMLLAPSAVNGTSQAVAAAATAQGMAPGATMGLGQDDIRISQAAAAVAAATMQRMAAGGPDQAQVAASAVPHHQYAAAGFTTYNRPLGAGAAAVPRSSNSNLQPYSYDDGAYSAAAAAAAAAAVIGSGGRPQGSAVNETSSPYWQHFVENYWLPADDNDDMQ